MSLPVWQRKKDWVIVSSSRWVIRGHSALEEYVAQRGKPQWDSTSAGLFESYKVV